MKRHLAEFDRRTGKVGKIIATYDCDDATILKRIRRREGIRQKKITPDIIDDITINISIKGISYK